MPAILKRCETIRALRLSVSTFPVVGTLGSFGREDHFRSLTLLSHESLAARSPFHPEVLDQERPPVHGLLDLFRGRCAGAVAGARLDA
jgi:hypothetical protein